MTDFHPAHAPSDDEAAIAAVFDGLADSWNRGDGRAYGSFFTDDADYIDVTGTHSKGGDAIGKLHQFLFDGPLKGSRLAPGENRAVQFLASHIALVVGGGTSLLAGQAEAPADRQSINTTILVKQDGVWRVRAFQINRVQPPAGMPPARR
jgi:uncharacterized protein (TIGR02246 family)